MTNNQWAEPPRALDDPTHYGRLEITTALLSAGRPLGATTDPPANGWKGQPFD
jgi:hypothetical protein